MSQPPPPPLAPVASQAGVQLPRTGTTAYGRACNNCAKAKCKCIPGTSPNGQGPCERCLRLRKDCQPAPSLRRKPGRKPISKTAQLQDKLDDLVTLLQNAAANSTSGTSADALLQQARSLAQVASSSESSSASPGDTPKSNSSFTPNGSSSRGPQPDNTNRPTTEYVPPSPVSVDALSQANSENNYGISEREAEECLHIFRTQKLPYLHFVYIPESTTAAELRREKPFLWLSIMVICVKRASTQQLLGEKLRALIAQKVIVEHQRSLDILQGLVGFLGWSTYHLRLIGKPFMTMYSHLLAALVQDLYFDKTPIKTNDTPHPMACMRVHGFIAKTLPTAVRTTEESRAVLASWIVSACVGTFLRRTFAMPWTSHMDDCLKILEKSPDSPLDGILIQQILMQRIAAEAPYHSFQGSTVEMSTQTRTACEFQIKALLQRLENTRQNASKDIPPKWAFICRLHKISTEIELREIALYSGGSNKPADLADQLSLSRIAYLTTILSLTKEWYSILLEQHSSQFLMFAFPMTSQIAYLTIVMYRLCTLDDPYWDKTVVHQTLDCFALLEKLAERFAAVPQECGLIADRPELDTWAAGARAIRHLKAAWEPVFSRAKGAEQTGSMGMGGTQAGCGNQMVGEGGAGMGIGGQFQQPGAVQMAHLQGQLGTGDPMDTTGGPMNGLPYDAQGMGWDTYAIDEMANQWIADMFAVSWDGSM
ncbi:hypothetical protein V8F33_011228 [Rhypophila sp. PSN 637]